MPHWTTVALKTWLWGNELVTETLVIPLRMVMRQVMLQNRAERILVYDHHLMERFLLHFVRHPRAANQHLIVLRVQPP